MMFKSILFFLIICQSFLFSSEELLLKNLREAKAGDFVVTAQGKFYTLFHIYKVTPPLIIIEEVTIPISLAKQITSWRQWLENYAPFNSSWIIYEINLSSGSLQNYFSFTKKGWFDVPKTESFFYQLLHLKLKPIALKERKKIGLRPRENQEDERAIWQPQLVIDGGIIPSVHFDAYQAKWPKDGSLFSNKTIEIYFPPKEYPIHFPYLLQVRGLAHQAEMRIIDSGSYLRSPQIYPP